MSNPHKNMEMFNICFKKGEHKKLVNALEENDKEKILDIIFEIYLRGDLGQ